MPMPCLMRIVDIADQLDCTTGQVLTACDELGIAAQSGATVVSEGDAVRICDHVAVMATRAAMVPAGAPTAPLTPPAPSTGFQLPPSTATKAAGPKRGGKAVRVIAGILVVGGISAWRAGALDLFTTQAGDLAVGDCVAFPTDTVGSSSSVEIGRNLDKQDCSKPHDLRVLSSSDLPSFPTTDGAPSSVGFPGAESTMWIEHCVAQLTPGYELPVGGDIAAIYPLAEAWSAGDRNVVCFEVMADGSQLPPVGA
jgi:hypothetical protein